MIDEQIYAEDREHYFPVFSRSKLILDHGEGPYVYDSQGKKYLDFLGGIAVNVLGHNYPDLVKTISRQAGRMIHCSNLYYTKEQAYAATKLSSISGMSRIFFCNSGAEANEGAIKLARKYAYQHDVDKYTIITANNSFHGRTLATLTATGQAHYHEGVGPLPGGFSYVDYDDIDQLSAKMNSKICAVMLEAIQGEGGVHVPSADYLQKVRALCDKYHALLIFDEIQCGMGRTGTFFAYEQFGVKADIVTLAKGLAGGVPIGAVLTSGEIASAFHPGDHGTTFGGNPLACSAATTVLDTLTKKDLMENAKDVGAYFAQKLQQLQHKYPSLIKEVRGKGLMLGMEITKPGASIVSDAMDKGLIINCTAGTVLRFLPPLIISRKHIDEAVGILSNILEKFA